MNYRDVLAIHRETLEFLVKAQQVYNRLEYGAGFRSTVDNLMSQLVATVEIDGDDLLHHIKSIELWDNLKEGGE